ncbi:MAG: glucose 1-dehydrogenase [Actinomycetota bacterium]
MTGRLTGRVAVVTGSAQGIGRAYAQHLAQLGAQVVVADIDEAGAQAAAKELADTGVQAFAAGVDIADPASTERLVETVIERCGSVDVLVNNAAVYRGLQMTPAEEIDLDYWRRMMDVNINGTYYMCRAVIPHMRQQGHGKIVNQTSIAAYLAAPLASHYAVSKAAVVALTKCLARELGEDGINVNAIAPGVIGTPATMEAVPEPMRDMLVMNAALHRIGQPEDLLGALEFLCSDMSDYLTGQTIVVDGGVVTLG